MKTTSDFLKMKQTGDKITMITAYDYPAAKIAEQSGIDMILVGDSLGMVVLGYDSTVPVTLEDMIHHTKAVKRGAADTFIVVDMPFMTYHLSKAETLKAAARLLQETGAHAVKVEGAKEVIPMIQSLTDAGVPVMAHLGLTPQSAGVLGGYRVQARTAQKGIQLLSDAQECQNAGAFALVLECIPQQLTEQVSDKLFIPTIGIGAGKQADGQVLVYHDAVGYGDHRLAKFVKQYTNVYPAIGDALDQYIREVKSGTFPAEEHSFNMKEEERIALYGGREQ
ncbi:3-methyl-2-oxobutanoate hydroxymethyltransferase [Jeotgalibacillus proteolyticus]|uniref:3-methyl-2-oxobutanoate hydroxymethyltransferase n=1 Tax=Jeotgalibacillus proteolyticus TaxID=2082395 RepID=A0A2S5GEA2_9BACL|nr:3-methyl-2-oxobutanoate hydroxymethyltransferase [Jeotgalibacillus proteolyticus]PPA71241.1 3-methyl-2-oxobutanoate hydroxymethyltransferase [Jeotgalibacillus proteolyticus]